ncbi:MAG: hypothetical protein P4M07_12740 [Xanthobacteraceae bacterium]|nr:hypothetical protein [Xanthobacteraceae bacterium]
MPALRSINSTAKLASMRQLHAAMTHFRKGNFDCAITLASAAEGILPATEKEHTFKKMKDLAARLPKSEGASNNINAVSVWLKHGKVDGKAVAALTVTELEVIAMVTRAVSKYAAVYGEQTPEMAVFVNRAIDRLSSVE